MKRVFTKLMVILFITVVSTNNLFAQTPEGIIYQAEARNASGIIISNENLDIKVTIHEGSANGSTVWEATHKVVTNDYGMFVLVIGTGTNLSGTVFADINWENNSHFLNVKINNGTGEWYDMGTSQFLSVPYALHAKTASALVAPMEKNGKIPGVNSQNWSLFGNSNTDPDKDIFGTTDWNDLLFVTDNTERLRIFADGQINIKDALTVDGDFTAKQNVYLNTEYGETLVNGNFTVANEKFTNLSGGLAVWGRSTIHNDLYITDNVLIDKTLFVVGKSGFYDDLTVFNGGNTKLSGNLNVEKDVQIDGSTTLNNTLAANGQVTIDANLSGSQEDYANYPLRIEGGKHGIAIKVNSVVPSRNDNFISFMSRDETILGRVEGMYGISGNITSWIVNALEPGDTPALSDIPSDVDYSQQPASMEFEELDLTSNIAVDAYSHGIDFTKSVIVFATNCIGAIAGAAAFGDIDDVVWSGVDVIAETIQFGMWAIFETNFNGVAFESGGADYAEWLEKKDINELFSFGDVVGINGGLISKDAKQAEKFMVITHNPTVIGAMPDSINAKKYERVAFMGQVPVKVIGKVKKGDYILPSGNQDGMAIAVSPNNMAVGDYARIIGTAWDESDGKELFSYVNTAVGINSNDLVGVIENMQGMLNDMQLALAEVNPNYTPQLYAMNGNASQTVNTITTSPTATTLLAQKSGALEAQTVEEAIQQIKEYAYTNNPNLDLSRFPYLAEMFENPTLETAEAMVEHYQAVLNNLIAMMPDTQN